VQIECETLGAETARANVLGISPCPPAPFGSAHIGVGTSTSIPGDISGKFDGVGHPVVVASVPPMLLGWAGMSTEI
jgi:hypothetical protein